jgi:FkbM family methyltransferase
MKNILKSTYLKLDKKRILFPKGIARKLSFNKIEFNTDILDDGGYNYYNSRKSYEECSSILYDLINKSINPNLVVDVGANYGFISCIAAIKMPQARIISIEPSKRLVPYIKSNFELNSVKNYRIINSICGETDSDSYYFSINPNSSQDNRVLAPKSNWSAEKTNMISLDTLLGDINSDESVFIKIDTQGFEEKVFDGAKKFLSSHNNWIIKTEFAPHWLYSQQTDPHKFLTYLVDNFEVSELTSTVSYYTESIEDLFKFKLTKERVEKFIKYIENLNVNNLGWCDLIIRPYKIN